MAFIHRHQYYHQKFQVDTNNICICLVVFWKYLEKDLVVHISNVIFQVFKHHRNASEAFQSSVVYRTYGHRENLLHQQTAEQTLTGQISPHHDSILSKHIRLLFPGISIPSSVKFVYK